jgi:hypothetical protein
LFDAASDHLLMLACEEARILLGLEPDAVDV